MNAPEVRKQVFLLGVRFDAVTIAQAIPFVRLALAGKKFQKIFTPNPEMLVKAQRDPYFKTVLNQSDLNLCDGRGTELALKYQYPTIQFERLPGADFLGQLGAIAAETGARVFLLGTGNEATVKKAAEAALRLFPGIAIVGHDAGPMLYEEKNGRLRETAENQHLLEKIRNAHPQILVVAFGMGKQEKWIHTYSQELPSVRIAVGVGGALSFLAGEIPRAPQWMRRSGCEWLYRFYQEPRRFMRIIRATLLFSYMVAAENFTRYRNKERFKP